MSWKSCADAAPHFQAIGWEEQEGLLKDKLWNIWNIERDRIQAEYWYLKMVH